MNRIENQTFENVVINFDGYTYINSTFNRCQLLFAGMAPAQYENCRFRADCVWTFAGPAQNTLSFLAGIYLLAPAGKELVDKIFQQIRGEQDPAGMRMGYAGTPIEATRIPEPSGRGTGSRP